MSSRSVSLPRPWMTLGCGRPRRAPGRPNKRCRQPRPGWLGAPPAQDRTQDDLDGRERVADQRDHIADERDHAADDRNHVADARERAADVRDRVADARDRAGDQRDRDRAADQRDRAADDTRLSAVGWTKRGRATSWAAADHPGRGADLRVTAQPCRRRPGRHGARTGASWTSDATSGTRRSMPTFRSVVSVLVSFVQLTLSGYGRVWVRCLSLS